MLLIKSSLLISQNHRHNQTEKLTLLIVLLDKYGAAWVGEFEAHIVALHIAQYLLHHGSLQGNLESFGQYDVLASHMLLSCGREIKVFGREEKSFLVATETYLIADRRR